MKDIGKKKNSLGSLAKVKANGLKNFSCKNGFYTKNFQGLIISI